MEATGAEHEVVQEFYCSFINQPINQSTYPVIVTIKDATLYDNQASVYGGNMHIEIDHRMHYGIECVSQNLASVLIERSSFSKGESQLGGGISVIFVNIGIPCDSQEHETPFKIHIFNSA